METTLEINVANLDASHRQALEEVIGCQLSSNHRVIISVLEVGVLATSEPQPVQTLPDWTKVYEGLSDAEIDEVDQFVNTRASLTRNLP